MIIWHNPRCSKSRQGLALLQENGVDPEVRLYLTDTPTEAELADVIEKLGISPRDLLRTGEAIYRELGLKDADDSAIIPAMAANPKLIERPIVIDGDRAVVGRPPENILSLL